MSRFVAMLVASAVFSIAHGVSAKNERPRVAVEVATPPPSLGADAAGLRTVAQAELKKMEALPRNQKRVVISLALSQTTSTPIGCTANATVRDARTGAVLAIIETNAHGNGPMSQELKKEMAYTVVRSAVRRVPSALRAKE